MIDAGEQERVVHMLKLDQIAVRYVGDEAAQNAARVMTKYPVNAKVGILLGALFVTDRTNATSRRRIGGRSSHGPGRAGVW